MHEGGLVHGLAAHAHATHARSGADWDPVLPPNNENEIFVMTCTTA